MREGSWRRGCLHARYRYPAVLPRPERSTRSRSVLASSGAALASAVTSRNRWLRVQQLGHDQLLNGPGAHRLQQHVVEAACEEVLLLRQQRVCGVGDHP